MFSIALYACETWTLKKSDRQKLLAFEMYCYRRVLRISWMDKVTNKEVRNRIHAQEDIIQMIMRRKLNLFGHICRMNDKRLIKKIMFGRVDGTTKEEDHAGNG